MADLLGLTFFSLKEEDTEKKVSSALLTANHLLFEEDYDLVLINVKDADEASHLKNPLLKKEVLERIDRGFGTLTSTQLLDKSKVVFALTADHPTPSTSTLIHSGEPTPLLVHAASLIPDNTRAFNEEEAARGSLPPIQAENLLAFLLNAADRIAYSGQILSFHERLGFPNPKDIKNFGL
jgi:2,3-bisphosphoglycerate-independent phosphoglycerate mutase